MTLTLTIIRFIFPFLLLVAFFCLYKKEYKFMKTFMWKMVSLRNSKLFYVSMVTFLLIFINWCCCMTDPNIAVALSCLITLILISRKIMVSVLRLLHERKRLWFFTVFVAMVCYAIPYMNSVFHLFFTLSMAAVFYPSEKCLHFAMIPNRSKSMKNGWNRYSKLLLNATCLWQRLDNTCSGK